jgi:hypothetical protein
MLRPLAMILCLALLGFALGGCSKCGWIWQDGGHTCRSDAPR